MADTLAARYRLALGLVRVIDRRLAAGQHFRDGAGRVLTRFDEVMLAIEEGRWPVTVRPDNGPYPGCIGGTVEDRR